VIQPQLKSFKPCFTIVSNYLLFIGLHYVDFFVSTVLQIISCTALMMQSYLVTEDNNERLNSNHEVFKWLVTVLDCAIRRKRWRGYGFAVIEVIEVEQCTLL